MTDFRTKWDNARVWQRQDAAVPWGHRILMGLGFDAIFLVAGWNQPWWVLVLVLTPFPLLVIAGILEDVLGSH